MYENMTILALFVFGVIVLDAHLPGGTTLVATMGCTILLSIVAHGLGAGPLAAGLRMEA